MKSNRKSSGGKGQRHEPEIVPATPEPAPVKPVSQHAASPRALWAMAGLFLFVYVLYWPVRDFEYVNYDDGFYVYDNPTIKAGLTWNGFVWAFTAVHAANWHPLTWLSHMLDVELFGQDAGMHHQINVWFHGLNAALFFFLLQRLTGAFWRSLVATLLFACHPLRVESVAWVAERKDVLSTLFLLLTVIAYTRYVAQPAWTRYAVVCLLFALGLMAKPMLVTLPCALLLLDFWPLQRFQLNWKGESPGAIAARLWPFCREKLPLLAISVASSVVTFLAQRVEAMSSLEQLPLATRLANTAISYLRYLGKIFWPTDLCVFYPYDQRVQAGQLILSLVILMVITGFAVRLVRSRPYFFTGWFWFVGTLVPVIGLVQVGGQAIADRYTYVPTLGLTVALVWGAYELLSRLRLPSAASIAVACLAIVSCCLVTLRQMRHWQTTELLFNQALRVVPDSFPAHNNLGLEFLRANRLPEAMEQYQAVMRVKPNAIEGYAGLGLVLHKMQRYEEALPPLRKALEIKPDNLHVRDHLAMALISLERFEEARTHLEVMIKRDRQDAAAQNNMGNVLAHLGKYQEALPHLDESLRLKPNVADTHNNYGYVLHALKRYPEAIRHYQSALHLQPNYPAAQINIGMTFLETGDFDRAAPHLRRALELAPGSDEGHLNLGRLLALQGKFQEAAGHFRETLRLDPKNAHAHFLLGAASSNLGKPTDAIEHYRKAVALQPDWAQALNTLARLLGSTGGDGVETLNYAERAAQLTKFSSPAALDTLAVAYANAGRYEEAIQTTEKALKLAGNSAPPEEIKAMHERLGLYRAGKPYRERPAQ